MEPGKVVAFFEQKKILLAVCLEVKGNKLYLLTEENREMTLGPNRIVLASSQTLNPTFPRESLLETLKEAGKHQKELAGACSIRELWELVWEERREFSLREFAELIFNPPVTFDQEMALFRALLKTVSTSNPRRPSTSPGSPKRSRRSPCRSNGRRSRPGSLRRAASGWPKSGPGNRPLPLPRRMKSSGF